MKAQKPTILNVEMTSSNTEYSLAIPEGTKKLQVATADGTAFRVAFVTGKVASPTAPYFTIPANTMLDVTDVYFEAAATLYVACGSASKVAQVIAWG